MYSLREVENKKLVRRIYIIFQVFYIMNDNGFGIDKIKLYTHKKKGKDKQLESESY